MIRPREAPPICKPRKHGKSAQMAGRSLARNRANGYTIAKPFVAGRNENFLKK
jgi:hypothetical protein